MTRRIAWILALGAAFCAPLASHAQTLAPGERPGDRPLRPGAPGLEPAPLGPPLLPPPPSVAPDRLAAGPRVRVTAFRVTGSTAFGEAELAETLAPWTGRECSSEELLAARDAVTLLYVRRGYVNSGAVLPDQTIRDGVIALHVVEGSLGAVELEGNRWFRTGPLVRRITHGLGTPLDARRLGDRLDVLQQDPRFRHLHAELVPGERPGEAVLRVRVEEAPPWHLVFGADNFVAPSIGAYEGTVDAAFDNLAGRGDTLAASFAGSEGLIDFDASYRIPVTPWDTALLASYRRSTSKVVEDPFEALDIRGKTETYGFAIEQPLWRTRRVAVTASVGVEHRRSGTELFDEPFAFTPGLVRGRTRTTPLRIAQEAIYRDAVQVFAARSTTSVGLAASDLDESDPGAPESHFVAWLGQLQYVRRFERLRASELIVRTDAQLTGDTLFPIEQYSIGGAESVRGYRENEVVRDAGLLASVELRVPVLRLPAQRFELQVAPFFDYGRSWSGGDDDPDSLDHWLASAGVGLRASAFERVDAEIYWGARLQHVEQPVDGDLQDHGVHFRVTLRAF